MHTQISMVTLPPWILIVVCCCRRFLTELCWKQFIHISKHVYSGECLVWLNLARHSDSPRWGPAHLLGFSEKIFKNRNGEQLEGESSVFSKASAEFLAAFFFFNTYICFVTWAYSAPVLPDKQGITSKTGDTTIPLELLDQNCPKLSPKPQAWNEESSAERTTRGSQELGLAANSLVLISVDPVEFVINCKSTNITWNRSWACIFCTSSPFSVVHL